MACLMPQHRWHHQAWIFMHCRCPMLGPNFAECRTWTPVQRLRGALCKPPMKWQSNLPCRCVAVDLNRDWREAASSSVTFQTSRYVIILRVKKKWMNKQSGATRSDASNQAVTRVKTHWSRRSLCDCGCFVKRWKNTQKYTCECLFLHFSSVWLDKNKLSGPNLGNYTVAAFKKSITKAKITFTAVANNNTAPQ